VGDSPRPSRTLAPASIAVIRLLSRHELLDVPNERSSYTRPTVRGGGEIPARSAPAFAPIILPWASAVAVVGGVTRTRNRRSGRSLIGGATV
jgi:hypothetical protein